MRASSSLACAALLAGCNGTTIDAGSEADGGTSSLAAAIVASSISPAPIHLVSDGTSLFWTSSLDPDGGPVSSIPIDGGAIRIVTPGPVGFTGDFLAVDDEDVYYLGPVVAVANEAPPNSLYRAPKDGTGSPVAVDGPVVAATVFGGNLVWIGGGDYPAMPEVKSAPLDGGPVTAVGTLPAGYGASEFALTATTGFAAAGASLLSFPLGGSGSQVQGVSSANVCKGLASDLDAVYCAALLCETCFAQPDPQTSTLLRVASDGTVTVLGKFFAKSFDDPQSGAIAVDDTYVYWVDRLQIGTIMRLRKPGGTPEIVARDAWPIAVAVDSNAVYWSDEAGNIMRLAK
jgi:hypothetical protein